MFLGVCKCLLSHALMFLVVARGCRSWLLGCSGCDIHDILHDINIRYIEIRFFETTKAINIRLTSSKV